MNDLQRFGQVIAILVLSMGPVAAAMLWANHVITDPESVAGSLATASVIAMAGVSITIGIMVILLALVVFWVWVFGIAWSSDEAREVAE